MGALGIFLKKMVITRYGFYEGSVGQLEQELFDKEAFNVGHALVVLELPSPLPRIGNSDFEF